MSARSVECEVIELAPANALVAAEPVTHKSSLPTILGFSESAIENMSKAEIRGVIASIEKMCKELGEEIEIPVVHHFSKGVYAREMQMPVGALVVGKIHKHENLNILSAGEVSVLSVDGIKRVKAPHTFVASEGAKRVIYAHEDTVWTSIHGTHERDIAKIEAEFITEDYADLQLESSPQTLTIISE